MLEFSTVATSMSCMLDSWEQKTTKIQPARLMIQRLWTRMLQKLTEVL